jgi:hypothetical protein
MGSAGKPFQSWISGEFAQKPGREKDPSVSDARAQKTSGAFRTERLRDPVDDAGFDEHEWKVGRDVDVKDL